MQASSDVSPLRQALAWPVARNSLAIAVVVGSILNLINQGDAMWMGTPVDWLKLCLTYCVPFCVSTWGAFSAIRTRASG